MRRRFTAVLAGVILSATSLVQAWAVLPNRIAAVDDAHRASLPNTVPARLAHAQDLGALPVGQQLSGVTLRFSLSATQQADLAQLLDNLQNPASPQYHQWLTPEEFGARFGLSSSDLSQVKSWLSSQGLVVTEVARSRTWLRVNGTVAQIDRAFGTNMHRVTVDGVTHFANTANVQLPAAIAGVVTAVTGLDDFKPQPRLRRSSVTPNFTSTTSGNHYLAPGDWNTIYNVTPLLSAGINGSGTAAATGSTYAIAVVGQVHVNLTDITAFRSASGLNTSITPTLVLGCSSTTTALGCADPGYPTTACLSANAPSTCFPSSGDLAESDLDLEWAGAIAPAAPIAFVYSSDLFNYSLTYAIDNNTAPIVSISYGACEADFGPASMAAFNQLFEQANAQGQTVVNSSGDSGATTCDGDNSNFPAVLGLSVGYPATSPYVTAVGGTMFNDGSTTGTTNYWNSNGSGTTSNGGSATGYIPELPWNESSSTNLLSAGTGGASAFFAKPAWQTGVGVPADSARDVPDVSFASAAVHDPYLYCSAGFCTSGYRNGSGYLDAAGGTSFATPAFAGALALIEQKLGSRLGNINPALYALAANSSLAVYNDVSSGNNNSPCVLGTVDCTTATGGSIGYSANAGYDLATGWGSMNIANAANNWATVQTTSNGATPSKASTYTYLSTTNTGACTMAIYGSGTTLMENLVSGVQGTLNVTVSVGNGTTSSYASGVTSAVNSNLTPTGTIQFTVDGKVMTGVAPQPLPANGPLTYALDVSGLSGVHKIGAIYSGDTNFAPSSGQLGSVTLPTSGGNVVPTNIDFISGTAKDFAVSPCSSAASSSYGGPSGTIPITITPANGFTGSVTFTVQGFLPGVVSNGAPIGYSFSASPVTITGTTAGTTVLTLYPYQNSNSTSTQPVLHGALRPSGVEMPWYAPAGGGVVLSGLLCLVLPRRRRLGALVAVLLSVAAISAVGCSSSSNSGGGTTTTTTTSTNVAAATGTYVLTVTATSGNISHSTTINYTIQ
ncbi:MAG: Ig-like domain repeat protein [Acidobacteriota bacterium]|nr:Ig-like domain repeat protein [Acidobacteriota bacterium]